MTWKRVATAVVLIPVVIALVLLAPTSVIAVVLALITLLALFEYFALGAAIGHRAYRFWTATCSLILVYLQWLASREQLYVLAGGETLRAGIAPGLADAFFVFVVGLAALTLWTKRPLVEGLPSAGVSSSALLLVAFPLSFAVRLHGIPRWGPKLLLFSLVIIWVGDTAAYFVGRSMGRFKLAPKLSPQKTWEGSFASLIGSLLVALVFSRWVAIPLGYLLGMAAAGNVFGQAGDLLESAYKRSAGVKDSGTLLPGHGGILDRIDALILAIPVVWYYWIWFGSPRM